MKPATRNRNSVHMTAESEIAAKIDSAVANGTLLDYDSTPSHSITVRVTDQGGLSFDKPFVINLTNVNEAPNGATLTGTSVAENAANGAVVGTLAGTDPDAGTIFSYMLIDNAGGRFAREKLHL